MKRRTAPAVHAEQADFVEGELGELGEECARVLLLLQRLARARAQGRDASDVLGELSAIVTHLHVHTKGLDELIDNLPSD
jgi:hypothetical protein